MDAPATILILEDDPCVAEDLRIKLVRLGYNVLAVLDTGAKALAFVETEAQARLMREQHCGFVQGFLFGRPQPPLECETYFPHA